MADDDYMQQAPGHARKGGTWVYDSAGRLLSIDGKKVPKSVNIVSEEVVNSLPAPETTLPAVDGEKKEGEE